MTTLKGATVQITEQTVRELVQAIDQAKKLANPPEVAVVASSHSSTSFEIALELTPHTQESLGYRRRP